MSDFQSENEGDLKKLTIKKKFEIITYLLKDRIQQIFKIVKR